MSLKEYVRKRRFEDTPEPAPSSTTQESKKAAKANPFFCVQRHDASHLHYDFRLEIGGALVSWAIPKGPSLDPSLRRFAAHVEDHPLEYGNFEGNIPEGNYGAGSVMLWDRGTFEVLGDLPPEKQLERGDLKFRLNGEKLKGEFAIVHMKGRGKGNEWLLLKKRDQYATPGWDVEAHAYSVLSGRTQEEIAQGLPAKKNRRKSAPAADAVWESDRPAKRPARAARKKAPTPPAQKKTFDPGALEGAIKAGMPRWVEPMKATLADRPPSGGEWLFEVKWDGVRALCFIEGGSVHMFSRNGNPCERQYPELTVLPNYVAGAEAILDGEIAVLDEKGVSRFELIQPRIANTDPNAVAHLSRSNPATLYLFDVLYLDGYDLRGVRLAGRKAALEAIITETPLIKLSQSFPAAGEEMLEAAQQAGLEGLIAKHANSCYEPKRSREWLKIKLVERQEFLICGFTEGEREYFSSLVLGTYDDAGKLVWVGNVGTGFNQRLLEDLHRRLGPLVTARSPFPDNPKMPRSTTWVKPELVCEVKFANWTQDGRLRAPVFLGLRQDVQPKEVRRERAGEAGAPRKKKPGPLLAGKEDEAAVEIDGRTLKFSNLNKVFYPAEGYTKRDILNYYDAVADLILPYLKDRPLSLKRYPNGISQEYFFQKNMPEKFAAWMRTVPIRHEHLQAPTRYVFADDRAGLLYLVNLGCIDHNPWMSRLESLEHPDFILVDLDPQECAFDLIVEAAQLVRQKLDLLGLKGYPKTTGGDGMHIYIPVEPVYTYDETKQFAEILAHLVIAENPSMFTTPRSVARRQKGRVYFDYLQNGYSKTIAAPYVLRAYPGAPVATPLRWTEVKKGLSPEQFNMTNAPGRFERVGDLFSGVLTNPQRIEAALEKLGGLVAAAQ